MKKYSFILILLAPFFLTLFASCNSGKRAEEKTETEEALPEDIVEMRDDQIKLANIELGAFEQRSLSKTMKVSGTVTTAPQDLASVCAPMGGFVRSTTLVPGNTVRKGQILAVLENQDFVDLQKNYLEAKNKLDFAEAEYNRHNQLYKEDVYSEKNLQQIVSEYKSLKAEVAAIQQKLILAGINPTLLSEDNISSTAQLVAPISGFIKSANLNVGKYVTPSDVLFEIVNNEKLLLELNLFEKDANKVAIGQKLRFFINNETEQHGATIYQTGKSVSSDRSYKVYANVTGKCDNVLPGMYVNATIETSNDSVFCLPSEAIVSFDDKEYIFVFEKNKEEDGKPFTEYKMVQITKGITDNGYTEIILPEGASPSTTKVVVKGAYNLLSAKKNAGEMAC